MVTFTLIGIFVILVIISIWLSLKRDEDAGWYLTTAFLFMSLFLWGLFGSMEAYHKGEQNYTETIGDKVFYCERPPYESDEGLWLPGLKVVKYDYDKSKAECYEVKR